MNTHLERMLAGLAKRGVEIGACGSCMVARGINEKELVAGLHRNRWFPAMKPRP